MRSFSSSFFFFFSSRRRHTRCSRDWSSDVCSSDLAVVAQRDSAALAATFLPELRSENTRLRSLLGLGTRLSSGYVPAEVLHEPEPSSALTFIVSAGKNQGVKPLSAVVSPEGLVGIVRSEEHTSELQSRL